MKLTKNITEGNIYKNLFWYALPLIASSFLSQAYSTIDGIIAGKFISEFALGAISATSSFETLFNALLGGFATGFAVYISHLFGKQSFTDLKKSVIGTTVFIGILAAAISILAILFRSPLLDYLQVDSEIRHLTERYFTIYTVGYVIYYVNSMLVHVLHALGITSFSLYITVLSSILNIGGNLLTILVFDMGVAGLALSTLLSAIVAFVVYIFILRRAFREMKSDPISLLPDFSCVTQTLRYTIPAATQMLAFHGIAFLIAPSINALGAAASTGYNISNRLYSFGTQSLWSTTSAFACYTGQCVGEGSTLKIRRGLKCGLILNAIMVLPFVLTIAIFARPIVSVFFPDGYTGEAFQMALRYAMIFLPFVYVQLVGHVLHAYMRSLGRLTTVLIVTLIGTVTRLVVTLYLIPLLQLDGVFIGQIVSWAVDGIASVILVLKLYRTDAQLERVIALAHGEKERAAANRT